MKYQVTVLAQLRQKAKKFDPAKMEAITTIPASADSPGGTVVDVIEAGYMYKQKVPCRQGCCSI